MWIAGDPKRKWAFDDRIDFVEKGLAETRQQHSKFGASADGVTFTPREIPVHDE